MTDCEQKTHDLRTARIRELNDGLRQTGLGGRICVTQGVAALCEGKLTALVIALAEFDAFSTDNDLYNERDFGAMTHEGEALFWKIDYCNLDLSGGSEDPAEPDITSRVLTVMLTREY